MPSERRTVEGGLGSSFGISEVRSKFESLASGLLVCGLASFGLI